MRAQSVRDQPIIAKVKKKNSLDSLCGHWNTATSHVGSRNPHKTHRTHTHIRTTISVSVAVLHLCFGLIGNMCEDHRRFVWCVGVKVMCCGVWSDEWFDVICVRVMLLECCGRLWRETRVCLFYAEINGCCVTSDMYKASKERGAKT